MHNGLLWITDHGGKLAGMRSTGTSCICNKHCLMLQRLEKSVCWKCFAMRYLSMRKALAAHLAENTEILTTKLLEEREMPFINDKRHRFESFGDIQNTTHMMNFIGIANHNPDTIFALWTKRLDILDEVFSAQSVKKPDNLIIVYSSLMLNIPRFKNREEAPWYVDKQFTVYEKEFAKEQNIPINCGKAICLQCGICYNHNDIFEVNELLK